MLGSSLRLEPFQYCVLRGPTYTALVLRQNQGYAAFLLPKSLALAPPLLQWARQVDLNQLKRNPLFQTI
ncbi:MAG: hypothetical protein HC918_05110 [Oscillatoriales cyanobacterium SM2_1_8]|nr:hypothetical protein [Oscillatoriales cyanobacterium SM2_1_8]